MLFSSFDELIAYYKQYGMQKNFGTMTQRSERGDDVKYVTNGCACGGKARNHKLNVDKARSTSKTNCETKINATKIHEMLRKTMIQNTHNDY